MPLPQSAVQAIALRIEINFAPVAISYDPEEKRIYWTDDYGRINRAFINNGSAEVVIRGINYPMGIAIDPAGRNIYFAEYYDNKIRITSLDGMYQAVLSDVENPQGITLDSAAG